MVPMNSPKKGDDIERAPGPTVIHFLHFVGRESINRSGNRVNGNRAPEKSTATNVGCSVERTAPTVI
jgi:hypothetical protein